MSGRGVWVFAGPSLPAASRPKGKDFHWRPPAIAGDAIEASQARPSAVVLIDGLFDAYPAIRHKELLALVRQGVPVIGAASMGALRAAELHRFGMVGVGRVFDAYASGRIEGDDEVAVLHAPAEMGWAPLSLAQVNVRATLAHALRSRILDAADARALRDCSARIFFQDRTWRALLEAASAEKATSPEALSRFADWLPVGYVDLKQRDALAALAVAAALPAQATDGARPYTETTFAAALARQVLAGLKPDPASA
jgi:hypothetical protein